MNLAGLHDIESAAVAPADTWVLDTVALSDNPPASIYPTNQGVITRLNWGYGSTGTLPVADQYEMFAQRVAQYVSRSSGCRRWQIGNETNLRREWPDQIPIYPWHYTAAYRLCRKAIRALPDHEHDEVLIAGTGPWNDECKYPDNHNGDWITYFRDVIELLNGELDGCSIHAYTHGYDPALVTSTARMDAPFHNRFYNFRCYQDYCDAIPLELAHLPVYLTEANGDGPWQATGLMPAMLAEINDWNYSQQPKIHCVVFYRYPKYDHFYIEGRDDVLNEYRNAVALGYQSPTDEQPPIEPPIEPPWEPEPEPTPEPEQEIDPALIARGVTVTEATSSPHWHLAVANFLNEQESGGRHHIYIETVDADYRPVPGINFLAKGQGSETSGVTNDKLGFDAANVPMWASEGKNGYTVYLDNGDTVVGLGMGDETEQGWNSGIHTSTVLTYQFVEKPPEPPQAPPHTEYVTAVAGANLRADPVDGLILATLPYREACAVVNETATQSDGYMWHGVNYSSHYGFIRSDLLSVRQPDEIVPPPEPEPTPTPGKLIWPVRNARITQRFGERYEYYHSHFDAAGHNGIDFGLAAGSPIYACADGVVDVVADDRPGYGLYLRLFHPQVRLGSLYAHCSEILVAEGQRVTQGQQIATVGSTGNSTGNHLHYELCAQEVSGGYVNVSYGHTRGRANPEIIMFLLGVPPTYE